MNIERTPPFFLPMQMSAVTSGFGVSTAGDGTLTAAAMVTELRTPSRMAVLMSRRVTSFTRLALG